MYNCPDNMHKKTPVEAIADSIAAGSIDGDQTRTVEKINRELQNSHGLNNDLTLINKINAELIKRGQLPAISITPDGSNEITIGVNAQLRRSQTDHKLWMRSPRPSFEPCDPLEPFEPLLNPIYRERDFPQPSEAERKADDAVIRSFTALDRFGQKNGHFNPVMPLGFEHDNISEAPLPVLNRDGSVTRPIDNETNGTHCKGEQRLAQNGKLLSSSMDYDPPVDLPIQGPNGRNVTIQGVSNVETRMQKDGTYETILYSEGGNYRLITDRKGVVRSAQPVRTDGGFPSTTPGENQNTTDRPAKRGAPVEPSPLPEQPPEPKPAPEQPKPSEQPAPHEQPKPMPSPERPAPQEQPRTQAPAHESIFEYINNNYGFIDKNEDGISADEIDEYINSRKSLSEGTVRRLLDFKKRIEKLAAAKDEWGFDSNVSREDLQESQLNAGMLQFAIKNWNELAGDDGRITADDIKIFAARHKDLSPEQQLHLAKLKDSLDSLAAADQSDNDEPGVTSSDIFKFEAAKGLDANLSQAFQGY